MASVSGALLGWERDTMTQTTSLCPRVPLPGLSSAGVTSGAPSRELRLALRHVLGPVRETPPLWSHSPLPSRQVPSTQTTPSGGMHGGAMAGPQPAASLVAHCSASMRATALSNRGWLSVEMTAVQAS